MRAPFLPLALASTLLLAACAGKTARAPEAPPVMAVAATAQVSAEDHAEAEAAAAVPMPVETGESVLVLAIPAATGEEGNGPQAGPEAAPPAASAGSEAAGNDAVQAAEDDFQLLYGHGEYDPVADDGLPEPVMLAPVHDPWEPLNRRIHAFNNFADRYFLAPLARAYVHVVPRPIRLGISNFFNNLGQPLNAFNALLQGRPGDAGYALLRFFINTTIGIGGLFDPASLARVPYVNEDFGQTLAVWGWRQSRYVELPLFGPRTLRDVFGMVGDTPFSLLPYIRHNHTRFAVQGMQLADIRSRLLSVDSMREGVVDDYTLVRDAWLQRRNYQILRDLEKPAEKADDLPDYLNEAEENPSMPVPVDVLPVVIPPQP